MNKKNDPNPVTNPSLIEAICSSGRDKILPRPRPGLREFVDFLISDGWSLAVTDPADGATLCDPCAAPAAIVSACESVEAAHIRATACATASTYGRDQGWVLVLPYEGDDWLADHSLPEHPWTRTMRNWDEQNK